jgi:hypothetical protein
MEVINNITEEGRSDRYNQVDEFLQSTKTKALKVATHTMLVISQEDIRRSKFTSCLPLPTVFTWLSN